MAVMPPAESPPPPDDLAPLFALPRAAAADEEADAAAAVEPEVEVYTAVVGIDVVSVTMTVTTPPPFALAELDSVITDVTSTVVGALVDPVKVTTVAGGVVDAAAVVDAATVVGAAVVEVERTDAIEDETTDETLEAIEDEMLAAAELAELMEETTFVEETGATTKALEVAVMPELPSLNDVGVVTAAIC